LYFFILCVVGIIYSKAIWLQVKLFIFFFFSVALYILCYHYLEFNNSIALFINKNDYTRHFVECFKCFDCIAFEL